MLRYRVAFDSDRGYFVLPTLPALVPIEETFASRDAAEKTARAKNAQSEEPNRSLPGEPFLRTFVRRASA